MTGWMHHIRRSSLGGLVLAAFLATACASAPVPVPSPVGVSPSSEPQVSEPPVPSDGPVPPSDGPELPIGQPMPGFAGYEPVQMSGHELAATVHTALSCDALTGWMQAGDWRLDGDSIAPPASQPPVEGAVVPPSIRWLVLSRPGDAAVARLVTDGDGSGCWGTVSRLSRQPLSAGGAFSTSTSALAYQIVCVPDTLLATVATFFIGDDGSRAIVIADVPLALGEHALRDGSVQVGQSDLSLGTLTESFTRSLESDHLATLMGDAPRLELDQGGTGTAEVTSIDPLVATLTFDGLVSPGAPAQSLTVGTRCDLPRNQLTNAAIPPPVTPPPTVAPGGTLEVSIGSGGNAISETLSGPQITCSFGIMGEGAWFLSHDDSTAVTLFLTAAPDGSATLTYYDWRPAPPVQVDIDPARTGGSLAAVVDDRGSEVGFTATGVTGDGRDVQLTATCAAIDRPG